jgi:hypothetical protein
MANAVHEAAINAFDHGVSVGCVVAGVAAVAGALLAAAFLPAQPPQRPEPDHQPAASVDTGDRRDLVR